MQTHLNPNPGRSCWPVMEAAFWTVCLRQLQAWRQQPGRMGKIVLARPGVQPLWPPDALQQRLVEPGGATAEVPAEVLSFGQAGLSGNRADAFAELAGVPGSVRSEQ